MVKNNGRRVTIKTIAEDLGLSFSTVSKALNDDPLIKDSTKQLVKRKIDELGYTPNAAARNLRQNSTHTISIIFNDLENPILTNIFSTIAKEMAPHYSTTIYDSNFNIETEKAHIKTALAHRSNIILLEPAKINDPNLDLLLHFKENLILFGAPNETIQCSAVQIDYKLGGYLAAMEMLSNNHRNCAVYTTTKEFPSCRDFLTGIEKAFSEFGLALDTNKIFEMESSDKAAFKQTCQLIEEGKSGLPTGFITFCDIMAAGIYKAAEVFNIKIPEQISVIGHDNFPFSDFANPKLTTISLPNARISENCTKLIKDYLEKKTISIQKYSLEPTLIRRNSVQNLKS